MDYLQNLLDSTDLPIVAAFLLGLLTALSPCPLATNITAIGFISKDISSKQRIFLCGVLYATGRVLAYSFLAVVLIYMLHRGIDTFDLQSAVSEWGERLIAPILLIVGVLMLVGDRLPLGRFGLSVSADTHRFRGMWGSLLLGVLFALAFCPTSGMFYFGMLIPMSASASPALGYTLPAVYAVATGLPVVVVGWLIAYSMSGIAGFYRKIQLWQRWLNSVVAVLFILVGVYYAYTFYL